MVDPWSFVVGAISPSCRLGACTVSASGGPSVDRLLFGRPALAKGKPEVDGFALLTAQGAMAALHSKAVFGSRAKAIGLGGQIEALKTVGWGHLANFTFSCTCVPGTGADEGCINTVFVPVLGGRTREKAAALCRL